MIKCFFLFFFFSLNSYSSTFNGYIIKFKENVIGLFNQSNNLINNIEKIETSFGTFGLLKSKNLKKNSVNLLFMDPNIEYIEPNWIIELDAMDNSTLNEAHPAPPKKKEKIRDEFFKKQWALSNTGQRIKGIIGKIKPGEDVNIERAWRVQKGKKNLIIAVIDTGIDYTHPELKGNMWVNEMELNGEEGVDDDGNGSLDDIYGYNFVKDSGDPLDDHNHGTHIAGIIGASHNRKGMMGIMKNVSLMALKFITARGRGETIDAVRSIDYAVKNGARVLSNSWGGVKESQALKEAIESARDAGVIFVAAGGNSAHDNDKSPIYPACYDVDNIISVGAMNAFGKKALFSSYGKLMVDVFAPGVQVLSTVRDGKYRRMSGTSMSTPMVAATLGLLLSQNLDLFYSDAIDRIIRNSIENKDLLKYGQGGRLDIYRTLIDISEKEEGLFYNKIN